MTYRLDYLTASGIAPPYRLLAALESRLPHIFTDGAQKPGRYGYALTLDCSKTGVTALLRFGLERHPDTPARYMLEVSGPSSAKARDALATIDPDHQIARLDVCRDVLAPDQFAHYTEVLQDLADRRGIHHRRLIHDPRDPAAGGTLYIGSPDSEARDVLYDKHAQDPTYEPGTLRFEHRLRPKAKPRKRALASMHAATAFRLGCIGSDIASMLDARDHPPATLPAKADRTAVESIDYMCRAYRRKLVELANVLGGPEAVLRFLRERLPEALPSEDAFAPVERCDAARAPCCPEARAQRGSAGSSPAEDMASAEPRRTGTKQGELVQSAP